MIKVEGLTKRYARNIAVDNISFEVGKGEIVGFLGPNGAGKTTTMRILTCFLPPTSGTASVAGFDTLEQPMEVKKRIGYLPENPPLYPDMAVHEYLTFVGKLKGLTSKDVPGRVDEAMKRCAVSDVRGKLIGQLSKGYRQRVGLAQAILHNPDVLILDEPTSGLDPKQIIEARELISSLAGDHTIILSTHILTEIEQSCDKVIIINKGKLKATDSVANLKKLLHGAEVHVEIQTQVPSSEIRQALEQIPGVSRVVLSSAVDGRHYFEVESLENRNVRGEIARAVVHAGWNLNELRPKGASLEDVFLQLTASEQQKTAVETIVE
jgi:ABC-2 type transport system ATP-binding protein